MVGALGLYGWSADPLGSSREGSLRLRRRVAGAAGCSLAAEAARAAAAGGRRRPPAAGDLVPPAAANLAGGGTACGGVRSTDRAACRAVLTVEEAGCTTSATFAVGRAAGQDRQGTAEGQAEEREGLRRPKASGGPAAREGPARGSRTGSAEHLSTAQRAGGGSAGTRSSTSGARGLGVPVHSRPGAVLPRRWL